jgi:hypothetical protein
LDPWGAQKELAGRLEALGYGKAFGIKNVKHHLNRALQREHIKANNWALHAAIIDALELTEAEQEELHEAILAAGRQMAQDERDQMARTPIQPGSKMYEGGILFYT